jgi:hypothetical protein
LWKQEQYVTLVLTLGADADPFGADADEDFVHCIPTYHPLSGVS